MEKKFPGLALFDVDGTLISVSSERMFLEHLVRSGLLRIRHLVPFGLDYLAHPVRTFREGKGWNRGYLRYVARDRFAAEARLFSEKFLSRTIRTPVAEMIRDLADRGCRIVLMSASLANLVEPLAGDLPIDAVVASTPLFDRQVFTGKLAGPRPWGREKVAIVRGLCTESGLESSDCLAVGDSWSDRHLMLYCGRAIAVHPNGKLRRLAGRMNWQVVEGRHTRWA